MKYLLTIVFIFSIFISLANAQPAYQWVLKRSGSSLGGPIDYNTFNPNLVYFGSGSIIYKSTDKGETFAATGVPVPSASETKCVILNDANPGTMLVAVESSPNDKIYKTTNDGTAWTPTLNEGQMSYYGIPVTQDPSHPNDIYTMINIKF